MAGSISLCPCARPAGAPRGGATHPCAPLARAQHASRPFPPATRPAPMLGRSGDR